MIHVVPDEHALANDVAAFFIECAHAAIAERGRFDVALAGGSTPKAMNALLAAPPLRERVEWSKVRFFFGDERCVPPDDPDSNYRMTRETLFDPLGIDASQIFRMRGEDPPQRAAESYAQTLTEAFGGGEPRFDLVMLGMGPDGHTASLFPGTLDQIDDSRITAAPFVPKFDTHRITLTPHVINAARVVAVASAGDAKADALRDVLEGQRNPDVHPIELIAPASGRLEWFVDRTAASKLIPSPADADRQTV